MGMTMTQKILAKASGQASVKAGDLIMANLNLVLGNDITSPVAIREFEKFGIESVFDKTKITGWVNNPYEYISIFDVAVLLSKWEGFGLCLAEYIALGKPVVATNVGAVSEIIQDGICGKLAESRNPERIADEIVAYKQCRDLKDIRQKCRESSERFDFKITAEKTRKMMADL